MKVDPRIYRFERNELDLVRYELRRAGRKLPLSRMPMELLILFIEQRGKMVTRDEIADRLWPDADSVDIVQGINTAISRIRAVLNDDAAKPRFIETIVGKGYRFIADVQEIAVQTTGPSAQPAPAEPLAAGLEPLIESTPEVAQPPVEVESPLLPSASLPQRRGWGKRQGIWIAAALAAVLLVAVGIAVVRRHPLTTEAEEPLTLTQITSNDSENRVTAASISPDGRLLAYCDADGISLKVVQGGATHLLRSPADVRVERIAWFADGLRLLVSGYQAATLRPQIWVISVTGEAPRLLQQDARSGVPSPDGQQVAYTSNKDSEIWIGGSQGEDPRQVAASRTGSSIPFLLWSIDGKRLLYQRRSYNSVHAKPSRFGEEFEDHYTWTYECVDAASGKVVSSENNVRFESASLLSDGRLFLLRWGLAGDRDSYTVWEAQTHLATSAFLGPPRLLHSFPSNNAFGLASDKEGTRFTVVVHKAQPDIYVGNLRQPGPVLTDVRRLTFDTRSDYPHAWTRDSESVLFESDRERQGTYHIYQQRQDTRTAKRLVSTSRGEVLPQFTPDHQWILYAYKPAQQATSKDALFRVSAAGGIPEPVPIGGPLDEFRCPLLGTGCVLRETIGHKEFVYYALDPIAGKGRELGRTAWMPSVRGNWDVSPDKTMAALPYRDPQNPKIRLVPLDGQGGQPREVELADSLFATLNSVIWAADGKGWYVAALTDVGVSLLYVNLQGGFHVLREQVNGTWGVPSPDGRKLAFLDTTVDHNVWLMQR